MDVKYRSGLGLRAGEIIQRSVKTLCIFNHWRRLHGNLPIQETLLRFVRYPYRIPRARRHSTGIQNTCLVRRYHLQNKRKGRRTRTRVTGYPIQTTRGGIPIK